MNSINIYEFISYSDLGDELILSHIWNYMIFVKIKFSQYFWTWCLLQNKLVDPAIWAAGGAFVASGGLIFNALSYRNNTNSRNLQGIEELAKQIETLEDSDDRNSKNEKVFRIFVQKYCNLHYRIAYLVIHKHLPDDLARYFKYSVQSALGLMELEQLQELKKLGISTLFCKPFSAMSVNTAINNTL